VVAHPRSSKAGFQRVDPRGLIVALNSPPKKGRANAELIALLARRLRMPRTAIALISGANSRVKAIRIATPNPAAAAKVLCATVVAATSAKPTGTRDA
jgi:uncharacterized protein YggU (UPF0235/DUF167 family)